MTQPLTREQAVALVDAYVEWQIDHMEDVVDELLNPSEGHDTPEVIPPSPASNNLALLAVAVFTSRTAMRRAYQLITMLDDNTPVEVRDRTGIVVRDLQEAILNCTNVIAWLQQQGVCEVIPPISPPADPKGGAS